MKKVNFVVVESPFAPRGNTTDEKARSLARNVAYVRAAMHDCFLKGEVPFASHAIYTQDGVLDDTVPEQRTQGIEAGFAIANIMFWASRMLPFLFTFKRVFYVERWESSGMKLARQEATEQGQVTEDRRLRPHDDYFWYPVND